MCPNIGECVSVVEFVAILRVFLVNPARSLRLLALRSIHVFCRQTPKFMQAFVRLKCDYLLARCMERGKQGEEERTVSFKVVKDFLEVDAMRLPKSIIQVLLCVADAKDDPCHAISVQILIELAVRNPRAMAKCGGMKELFRLMLSPPHEELLPILASVFSYLLDDETTRQYVLVPHDIKVLLAPLTDTFQCDEPVIMQQQGGNPAQPQPPPPPILGDNRTTIKRWSTCIKAAVLMLKSWSGVFIMAAAGGFHSMVSALQLPSLNLHGLALDGLLEIFRIHLPAMGAGYNPFLKNVMEDNIKNGSDRKSTLREKKGDSMSTLASSTTILDLPSRAKMLRHNWMMNYLSLLLINFKKCGLFEALVKLGDKGNEDLSGGGSKPVADSDEEAMNEKRRQNGIKATILLAELLDLSQETLAPFMVKELHTLPILVRHAATFDYDDQLTEYTDARIRTRAGAMVAHLQQWASLKGSDNAFMGQVNTSGANKFRRIRGQNRRLDRIEDIRLKMEWDIDEATLLSRLRATGVLQTKDWNKWDFRLMGELLEGPLTNPTRIEWALSTKFFKRILSFARPDTKQLFTLPWSARNLRYVQVVCLALEVLTLCDAGTQFLTSNKLMEQLAKMIADEVEFVQSKSKEDPERALSPEKMVRTMVKEYFTLIGTLSGNKRGITILNDTKIFSLLVPLISSGRSDLCKVIMTSLDYSQAGSARVLLSKVLQNKTMPIRYLATGHLNFLLRAGAGDVRTWGIEFACKVLKDPEPRIVRASVALLDEASDDEEMLLAFIGRKPDMLLDVDHPGKFLAYRFLSIKKGFEYLKLTDFIERELHLWAEGLDVEYVEEVESKMAETVSSDAYKQSDSNAEGGMVNLMPHLYGELAKTEMGFDILKEDEHFCSLMETLRVNEHSSLKWRAALWCAGHVGATELGLQYLMDRKLLDCIFDICVTSPSLSNRGTALMVLGLIGSTEKGGNILRCAGWSQPVSEVPKLVAVPNDATLDLLMQVPQPVYTGGSWTANFDDPEVIEELKKSAREETVKSARELREQAARREAGTSPATSARGNDGGQSKPPHLAVTASDTPPSSPLPPTPANALSRNTGRGRAKALPKSPRDSASASPVSPRGRGVRSGTAGSDSDSQSPAISPRGRGARASAPSKVSPRKKLPSPPPDPLTVAKRKAAVSVPPLTKLDSLVKGVEFDANPVKESFSEQQKTILKLIVDMTSHITTEKALRQLKKLRRENPDEFLDPSTFLAALKLLEMYRFKLMIRRFVYELFGECIITHQQFRAEWDDDGGVSPRASTPKK